MLRDFLAEVVRALILGQVEVQCIRGIPTNGAYVGGLQSAKYNREEDVIRDRARLYSFFLTTLRVFE